MMAEMIEVPPGADVYIGRDVQRMPRVECVCGRVFWSILSIDRGQCPPCQDRLADHLVLPRR
jgi:hypothetical protein